LLIACKSGIFQQYRLTIAGSLKPTSYSSVAASLVIVEEDNVMTRISINAFTLLAAVIMLGACTNGEDQGNLGQRMFIHHHKNECHGLYPTLCLLTRESELQPWSSHYDPIRGFTYEWGYDYELRVLVTEIPNPPADASSLDYVLLEIVQKNRVAAGTEFEFPSVWAPELIKRKTESEFELGYMDHFMCDAVNCETVASLLEQEMSLLLEFRFTDIPSDPIQLLRVSCSDTEASFRQTCL